MGLDCISERIFSVINYLLHGGVYLHAPPKVTEGDGAQELRSNGFKCVKYLYI